MALIDCPACNKKVSDKAKICACGFKIGSASAEDIERKRKFQRFQKSQSIQNQSMVAMLLFITGFGLMYWGEPLPAKVEYYNNQHYIAVVCCAAGFIWYIVNRVRLILVKRLD